MGELHAKAMAVTHPRRAAGSTALVVLLLGLAACGDGGKRRPGALVRTAPVTSQRFEQSLNTVSTLEATDEIDLAAQAGGRVQRVLVRTGDAVRAGQLLVVLDQTQLRADVQALQAKAKRDALAYRRFRGLVSQGAASALQAEEFQANAIGSREALRAKQADLAYKDIRAPISGVMADLTIKPGDVLAAGTPFSRIIRNERLMARIDVPAGQLTRLQPGQPVQLLGADGAQPLAQGRISQVDPSVSAGSQTLLVKAAINNPDGLLRNGQRLRTRVLLGSETQLAVPFAAVTRQFGQAFVFVVGNLEQLRRDPGRADLEALSRLPKGTPIALQRPVQIGPLQHNSYPVLQGLQAGERVIVSGAVGLRHGSPIRISRAGARPGAGPAPAAPGAS
jgi:RND family efflux transporter MFP subunit